MYLLDTNVLSELRKAGTSRADPNVDAWLGKQARGALYLSVVTLMEIEIGILRLARRDTAQAVLLRRWFDGRVRPEFAGSVLAIDDNVALRAATMQVPVSRPERDTLIAATAAVHGLAVVTRNLRDFRGLGVRMIDPWAA